MCARARVDMDVKAKGESADNSGEITLVINNIMVMWYISLFIDEKDCVQVLQKETVKKKLKFRFVIHPYSFSHFTVLSIVLNYSEQQLRCGQPIFEYPPAKYTSERILQILLNSNISDSKICTAKPIGITTSATFVVDIRHLKCLDDVKKDEFGIWKFSGSHPKAHEVTIQDDGYVAVEKYSDHFCGDNIVHLRHLHCTHPSNQDFKRMICVVSGMCHLGMHGQLTVQP